MAILKTAFWNVENLYNPEHAPPNPQPRATAPKSMLEYWFKIKQIGDVIKSVHAGTAPHLIGIAEVADQQSFERLGTYVFQNSVSVYEPSLVRGQCGLGILAGIGETSPIMAIELLTSYPASGSLEAASLRPRVLICRCTLKNGNDFLFVVNHWKSKMVWGTRSNLEQSPGDTDREITGRWVRETLENLSAVECVIVVGDFNAEPFELSMTRGGLRSERCLTVAHRRSGPLPLYNTAWRMLCSDSPWAQIRLPGYREIRPQSSVETPGVIFDQLLVSRSALENGPLQLDEDSVRLFAHTTNSKRVGIKQRIAPRRWPDTGTGWWSGCASDHLPLCARFDIL